MNKKILLVAHDFPPYHFSFGYVVRAVTLAEFLSAQGVEVHVVAARQQKVYGYFGYESLMGRINVHYVDSALHRFYNRMLHRWYEDAGECGKEGRGGLFAPIFRNSMFRRAVVNIGRDWIVPDHSLLLRNAYVRELVRLIEEHDISTMFVTSPWFGIQLAAREVKSRFGERLKWIVDYRDSWTTSSYSMTRKPLNRVLSHWTERRVLRACDGFTYVSPPILDKLVASGIGDGLRDKAFMVMNGFARSPECREWTGERGEVINIGYFGCISDKPGSERDPLRFVNYLDSMEGVGRRISITFFGHADLMRVTSERYPFVRYGGRLEHEAALRKMCEMDYLLVLHDKVEGADEVFTGKVFEYIAARRPILCVGPKTMAVARLVKERRLGIFADIEDERDVRRAMERVLADEVDFDSQLDITEFSRTHQYARLLEFMAGPAAAGPE